MRSITISEWIRWLIPFGFMVLLAGRIILHEPLITHMATMVCLSAIGLYLLLFKKELFISILVFSIPISVTINFIGGSMMSAPSELMLAVLAIVFVFIAVSEPSIQKKIIYHPLTWLLVIDTLWLVITSFNSEMQLYSFKRVLIRSLYLIIFYLMIAQWVNKKGNMLKFFLLYSVGLIIPILVTEYKHSAYNFDPRTVFELCKPFFNDHTIFGACIAYVIPFMIIILVNRSKFGFGKLFGIGCWFLFIILIVGEFFAFSRAAWLSLGVSALFYVFLKFKLKFYHFIIALGLVVALFYTFQDQLYDRAKRSNKVSNKGEVTEHIMSVGNLNTDASNLERINRWNSAIRMYYDRPITGFGPGTYQFTYGPYQSVYEMTYISTMAGDRGNAHSEPLTYLSESGLPGLISFIIWTLATIGFGMRAYYRSVDPLVKNMVLAALLGFITFYFHGMVNSFIDQVKMAGLVFSSMAIIVAADIYSDSNSSASNEK